MLHSASPRFFPLLTRALPASLSASLGAAMLFAAGQATAADQQYAPPPNYAPPSATVTYAPPPSYGQPPPAYVQGQPPQYTPPPAYGYGQHRYYGEGFDIARQGGVIGGTLGFGTDSYYGFGLGVWGGYTLPAHVYLGGAFNYFTGDSVVSSYLFEFQAGYDIAVSPRVPILIRPYLGLGYEHFSVDYCGPISSAFCDSAGGGSFLFSLGAQGSYFFTPHWFAGIDLRLDIPTHNIAYTSDGIEGGAYDPTVFNLLAQGGYKF